MLQIKNLTAKTVDTNEDILKKFNLDINDGEVHAIMGPNGTGKSTLSKVIMGHYKYKVTSGDIIFNNTNITKLDTSDRAKLGLFLVMQDPTVIPGVSNSEFLKTAMDEINDTHTNLYTFVTSMEKDMQEVGLSSDMLHRAINENFSGGEKKKNEILQLKMLKPKCIILDELDSGLDVDSLKLVCDNINSYLKENKDTSVLIITHYPRILEYIKPNYVHVMKNGKIMKTGDMSLALEIDKTGYGDIDG
jgi:Fe-S cluster assembly ATP-binding protein